MKLTLQRPEQLFAVRNLYSFMYFQMVSSIVAYVICIHASDAKYIMSCCLIIFYCVLIICK